MRAMVLCSSSGSSSSTNDSSSESSTNSKTSSSSSSSSSSGSSSSSTSGSSSSSSGSGSSGSSDSLRKFALCQIHDVLRHGHVRGYTLDPGSRSTLCQAKPGMAPDRANSIRFCTGNSAFFIFFFKTCDTMLRQWVVKSKPFSKVVLHCRDNGRAKVMIFHAFYKNRISILRQGVRLGCNLY